MLANFTEHGSTTWPSCLSNAGYEKKKNNKAYLMLIIHYRTDPSTAESPRNFFSSFLTEVGEEEIVMDWRSEGNEKVEAVGM